MNIETFQMRHRRRKGEDLRAYVLRVITTECDSDIPGVKEDMIEESLAFYRNRVAEHVEDVERERAANEQRHLQERLADLSRRYAELQSQHDALRGSMPTSISIREAEQGRLGAFRLAIFKAAALAENQGVPTELSVAIENLPEPKPKWTK